MQHKSIFMAGLLLALVGSAQAVGPYTYSTDGAEVTDTKTGLVWRRCAEGMSWSGSTCTGSAASYTHSDALLRAASEATASGKAWRLPNVKELESIVDASRSGPAIDIAAFPATPSSWFWSSSPVAGYSGDAWGVGFGNGYVGYDYRDGNLAVRLVRSGQ